MTEASRILEAAEQGDPQAASQLLPLVYDELRQIAAQRLALEAENDEDAIGPDWAGVATGVYLNNRKVTIYGGTSEVQHNILAKAVLGL